MTQLNNSNVLPSQILHSNEEETFTYNGSVIKIITVFNDTQESIAMVEDENGNLFEVPKDSLR